MALVFPLAAFFRIPSRLVLCFSSGGWTVTSCSSRQTAQVDSCFMPRASGKVRLTCIPPSIHLLLYGFFREREGKGGTKRGRNSVRGEFGMFSNLARNGRAFLNSALKSIKVTLFFFDDEAWILYSIPSTSSRPNETGAGV